jgi:hypothetical protein
MRKRMGKKERIDTPLYISAYLHLCTYDMCTYIQSGLITTAIITMLSLPHHIHKYILWVFPSPLTHPPPPPKSPLPLPYPPPCPHPPLSSYPLLPLPPPVPTHPFPLSPTFSSLPQPSLPRYHYHRFNTPPPPSPSPTPLHILTYIILYYSILFYTILYYSILFNNTIYYSILSKKNRNLNNKIAKIAKNNHFLQAILGMIKSNYEKVI